ncbi:response regulator [Chamaesiphon sp. VAR_48_metabat_403]|uniref:response regulator n=1 Tax=Chamaesiphon sp. VAR_48_metabat_403 TaxID=2964700 RepID=UPI00286E7256|nr:response regulator [Chamaesiphon sp. VAR_48_metabat_403]
MTESKLTTILPTQLVTAAELPALQSMNILVVEDDEDILALIAIMLERAGASVTAVSSASAALLALAAHPHYDLLLSDLAMPEIDGWSLIRQVRALPAESGGKIPAIALTAYSSKKDRNISEIFGFQLLLAKPIESDRLVAGIIRVLGPLNSNLHPILRTIDPSKCSPFGSVDRDRSVWVDASQSQPRD